MLNMARRLTAAKAAHPTSTQCLRSHVAIADIAHRLDQAGTELRPQPADVDVDHVGTGVEGVAPDVGEQLIAATDVASLAHQVAQQQELAVRQDHRLVLELGHAPGGVQRHAADPQPALLLGGAPLGGARLAQPRPVGPSAAQSTSKPAVESARDTIRRIPGSSSIIKIRDMVPPPHLATTASSGGIAKPFKLISKGRWREGYKRLMRFLSAVRRSP